MSGPLTKHSAPLHLLHAHRPQPRRPSGSRDRTRLQDRPLSLRGHRQGVDQEVRHLKWTSQRYETCMIKKHDGNCMLRSEGGSDKHHPLNQASGVFFPSRSQTRSRGRYRRPETDMTWFSRRQAVGFLSSTRQQMVHGFMAPLLHFQFTLSMTDMMFGTPHFYYQAILHVKALDLGSNLTSCVPHGDEMIPGQVSAVMMVASREISFHHVASEACMAAR